uniref:Uncharacterized protein n=1 Tax=Ferula sinkiangensis TaxID=1271632 RepID=A0A8K1R5L6_9APIA|nr:hypothetical protein [Ferula sinkiangensis]
MGHRVDCFYSVHPIFIRGHQLLFSIGILKSAFHPASLFFTLSIPSFKLFFPDNKNSPTKIRCQRDSSSSPSFAVHFWSRDLLRRIFCPLQGIYLHLLDRSLCKQN